MNAIVLFLRRIVFGHKATSDHYIEFLRSKGARIGNNVKIYSPNQTHIDEQFPFMLSIGDNVNITSGVQILNHDYSWSVIKKKAGMVLGAVDSVEIGNNVFIGVGAIILMGSKIGDNCIIGAGSIVRGTIPSNSVAAGNPAKVICSLDTYTDKRMSKQYDEAANLVRCYRKSFGKNPPKEQLPAYFFLFEPRANMNNPVFLSRLRLTGNYADSLRVFESSTPLFDNYTDFLNSVQ